MYLNQNSRKYMKWINVMKCGGGGMHLNQNCRKFYEMDKSIKKIFFYYLADWGGGGVVKNALDPKLQEISCNV